LAARNGHAGSAAASMSAHQIGLQLLIFGSLISDALTAVSPQALSYHHCYKPIFETGDSLK